MSIEDIEKREKREKTILICFGTRPEYVDMGCVRRLYLCSNVHYKVLICDSILYNNNNNIILIISPKS